MRPDSIGLFWQDIEVKRSRNSVARVMPEIPPTSWKKLNDLPNLARAATLSIDLETNDESLENDHGPGWARGVGHIAGIAVGADDDGRWYFPIRHTIEPQDNYEPARILDWLRVELGRKAQPKVGANLLYDIGWLKQEGVEVLGDLYDVQFAEALLDEDAFVALETLGRKYCGEGKTGSILYQWLSDYYGGPVTHWQARNIYRSPPRLAAPYAEGDVDLPLRVLAAQWPLLERAGLLDLFRMECRLIPLLVAMRFAGVRVDIPQAERARDALQKRETEHLAELKTLVGFDVNVDASASLAKVFDHLGLPYGRTAPSKNHPDGQPSFTKEFFATVKHPVAQLIRKTRSVAKTRSTFIEGYMLDSHVNGVVYPSFHPLKGDENGAVTGRFASSNPTYHNLPAKDDELGLLVRGCAVPDIGHKQWRKYDWSQLQYRFLAHYAVGDGADEVRRRFNEDPDADYHDMIQSMVKEICAMEMPRKIVKNVNFGTVFGMGKAHMIETFNMPEDKAIVLLDAIHRAAPYMKASLKACSAEAQTYGIIRTILGRQTHFNQWAPKRFGDDRPALPYDYACDAYGASNIKRAFTHKALNYKLQGSEGDLMKTAMLKCWDDGVFSVTGVPRLTVHDELDFSDPGGVDDAFDYVAHVMETAIKFSVPVSVGCDVGASWGACL